MIRVDVSAIETNAFKKGCVKLEPLLSSLFERKNQPGYAFLALPDDELLLKEMEHFAKEQKEEEWEAIVALGIGGSALGLIAIRDALLHPFPGEADRPQLYVLDNIDPGVTSALFDTLNLEKTLFVVISKSGTTIEPMFLYGLVKERLLKFLPKTYQRHLVFITDPNKGPLRQIALKEGITIFDVPEKVGGRFSVLSAVGLLPAALAGVPILGLLRGAAAMRKEIQKKKGVQNPALALAFAQSFFNQKKKKVMTVMMPYSSLLFRFGDWYRQLLAESLGKNESVGPTPLNALGTTDQHSQLQLYAEGPDNKFFIFLRLLHHAHDLVLEKTLPKELGFLNEKTMAQVLDASLEGARDSLLKKGRPIVTVEIDQLNAEALGALFMLFEIQVALLGEMYGVNAFDQPGVEESKQITKKLLQSKWT